MKVETNTSTQNRTLTDELHSITRVIEKLLDSGAQVREIRVHGRARPAIVLNRPPQLSGNAYAWGKDKRGRRYERQACTLDGVQIQWEARAKNANKGEMANIIQFPYRTKTELDLNAVV